MSNLPAPLTPPGSDLRDFAFLPLDVVRLRDSDLAVSASADEFRCAVLLWCAAWHQVPAGSLPDDDKALAQYAGYGRVVKEWMKVRVGALRGWIKCDDGRLYHPVVAEKACDAWTAKLRQRHKTEANRIKKHNERHQTAIPVPDFDVWFAAGCPTGQPLFVPNDTPPVSLRQPGSVTDETASKGEGEGQGQGQLTTKASGSGGSTDPGRAQQSQVLPPPLPPLSAKEPEPLADNPAVILASALRRIGVADATFTHPAVKSWVAAAVPMAILEAALIIARERKGGAAKVPANFLALFVDEILNPPAAVVAPGRPASDRPWKASASSILAMGQSIGLSQGENELIRDYAGRIETALGQRQGATA